MNRMIHRRIYWSILLSIPGGIAGMLQWRFPEENALLRLILLEKPPLFYALKFTYLAMLYTTPFIAFSVALSSFYIFVARRQRKTGPICLPPYPPDQDRNRLYLVIGEVHHPKKPEPVENPRWFVIPDRGLFTGIAVFGAIGTGKTTGCMYPFTKQLLTTARRTAIAGWAASFWRLKATSAST